MQTALEMEMATGSGIKSPMTAEQSQGQSQRQGDRFRLHSDGSVTYTVQEGDNLSHIARQAFLVHYSRNPDARELLNSVLHIDGVNQLRGQLRVGQVLEWKAGLNLS